MAKQEKTAADFEAKWAKIIKRTATDEVFKQKLLKNPNQVLKENGIEIPSTITLKVVENTKDTRYIVLPESQVARDLSEDQLKKVSGGFASQVVAVQVVAVNVQRLIG
jgi:hypothetical protein